MEIISHLKKSIQTPPPPQAYESIPLNQKGEMVLSEIRIKLLRIYIFGVKVIDEEIKKMSRGTSNVTNNF